MPTFFCRVATLAASLGLALSVTAGAADTTFQLSPLRVNLTARDHVASVTLTNVGDAPLRLEVQAFNWTQAQDGEAKLDPTTALIVFPELLTIPPGGQRRLRVATADAPGPREATYKVAITEIAAFATPKMRTSRIDLALQANVPVFIAPAFERRNAAISRSSVQKRALTFDVVNAGTVHFITSKVRVSGLGSDTRPLFAAGLEGGDVLADGKREYRVELPSKSCRALRALTIRLEADEQELAQTLEVPPGGCDP